MVAGRPYRADDPELVRERVRARRLTARYALVDPGDAAGRHALLGELVAPSRVVRERTA